MGTIESKHLNEYYFTLFRLYAGGVRVSSDAMHINSDER